MCCQAAVIRAYREMRNSGAPPDHALEAALTVYRFHHPGEIPEMAEATVMRWTEHSSLH